jgi:endo-1,4-beta-xylanase
VFSRISIWILICTILLFQTNCDNKPAVEVAENNIPELKEKYNSYFPVGAAVTTRTLHQTDKKLLLKHFNSITAEYQMKMRSILPFSQHPSDDIFCFENADKIVDFALKNDRIVRGHTLIWHKSTPGWFFRKPGGNLLSRDELLGRMRTYIRTIVTHFKGKVHSWDVVNEAVADDTNTYRNNLWYKIIGADYIEKAFVWAHEADPDSLLYYNDYFAVFPPKREKIYKIIKDLLSKGIPVHGIGIQAHWDLNWPKIDEIKSTIEKFTSLGVAVQFTELDVSIYSFKDFNKKYHDLPENLEYQQAVRYGAIFELFRQHRDVIAGVTLWGIADDHTWLDNYPVKGRKNWPLIFDMQHRPKNSFWEIVNFQ